MQPVGSSIKQKNFLKITGNTFLDYHSDSLLHQAVENHTLFEVKKELQKIQSELMWIIATNLSFLKMNGNLKKKQKKRKMSDEAVFFVAGNLKKPRIKFYKELINQIFSKKGSGKKDHFTEH